MEVFSHCNFAQASRKRKPLLSLLDCPVKSPSINAVAFAPQTSGPEILGLQSGGHGQLVKAGPCIDVLSIRIVIGRFGKQTHHAFAGIRHLMGVVKNLRIYKTGKLYAPIRFFRIVFLRPGK